MRDGTFEMASHLDDLLSIRERAVEAIASYEVINWAQSDEQMAEVLKRHFVESSVLR